MPYPDVTIALWAQTTTYMLIYIYNITVLAEPGSSPLIWHVE